MTFEINVKFDTGRQSFKISLSKPVFIKSGRMRAVLSDLGIIDSPNDMLTISVIRGTKSAMHSFRSQVCKGSSSHDLTGDSLIIFLISGSVASIKVFSGTPEKQFVTEPPVCVSVNPSSLLIFNILLMKKALKSYASYLLQV